MLYVNLIKLIWLGSCEFTASEMRFTEEKLKTEQIMKKISFRYPFGEFESSRICCISEALSKDEQAVYVTFSKIKTEGIW